MPAQLQPPANRYRNKLTARLMLVLSAGIGGVALMAFAVFLLFGPPGVIELDLGLWGSLVINMGLSILFFVQHSGMVRRSSKAWLARVMPRYFLDAAYAIVSGIVLLSVVLVWQESEHIIATATGMGWWAARLVFCLAVCGFVWSALSLQGFDTFGLGPIRRRFQQRASRSPVITVRGPYRWVRHPQYSFVILMIWSYPVLTVDRALFNVLWTTWIVIGTVLEERDLVVEFGEPYRAYQRQVPMLIPGRTAGWSR